MSMTIATEQVIKPPAAVPAARIVHGTKIYGKGATAVRALDAISADFAAGKFTAIMGPSGSGKSTLLHVTGTLDRPSGGRVRVTGLDVAELADRDLAVVRSARIGFVFQQFFLADGRLVRELLDPTADRVLDAIRDLGDQGG